MIKVSIIMAAYNTEKYISTAIDSILAQTFNEWELIICDDCSTDNTVKIIEEYCKKDNRIRLIKRSCNSGGTRIPNRESAMAATASLIMTFDADDFLDCDYIEKLYLRKKQTGANVVLSRLSFCNEKGEKTQKIIPNEDFDYSQIISGKEAAKLTLGEIQISISGLLIDKDIFIKNTTTFDRDIEECKYDEIDKRRLILQNEKVAFTNTKYYYRQQPSSLMHNKGVKRYDFLKSIELIYRLAKENYKEKEVFDRLDNEFLTNLLFCQRDYYLYNHNKLKEAKEILEKLKSAYKFAKAEKMNTCNLKQKICMLSFPIFQTVSYIYSIFLKYKQI